VVRTSPDVDDLLSDRAVNDPVAFYGALRDRDPVHFNPLWNGWVLTRYDDVAWAFRSHEQLPSDRFEGPWGDDFALTEKTVRDVLFEVLSKMFVWKDPPYHTRVRTLVNKAFSPKSIEQLRPRAHQLVGELLDDLPLDEPVDFLHRFAFHLPVVVISEYLGIPTESRDAIKSWSDDLGAVIFVKGQQSDRAQRAEAAVEAMIDFLRPIVGARRHDPRDDLLSGLVHVEEGADSLTEDEVIANTILMVFAGHETTMNLIGNGTAAFWRHPDQWQRLQRRPGSERLAVEEILRWDGPIRTQTRWARRPVELGGRTIGARDRILLVQVAANHDPGAFDHPERFDIGRVRNRHLTFGHGIHTCLGAPLARMEAQEAFRQLADRFERVDVLDDRLTYHPTIISGSLTGLHVALRPKEE
jgi:cytochrome P450